MNRCARLAAILATTAALTVTASAAQAKPGHSHSHSHSHQGTTHGGTHGTQTKVLRALAHLDRRLGQATRDSRVGRLSDADAAALLANAAADSAAVEGAEAALTADPSDANLAAAQSVLDTFRPTVYVVAVNLLRHAERVAAEVVALQATVDPASVEASGLADAATLLAGVQASGFTATTDAASVRAAQHAVAQAQTLVGQIADALAGS
jgi:hypothetical protein